MSMVSDVLRRPWLRLVLALLVLDVSLTFQNVWPTPAVRWSGGLSVEVGVCLLALAALAAWRGRVPTWLVATLAWIGVVLAFGRYAIVTSPALFGRDVNLYWDLRFIPDVIAMLARPASWPVTLGTLALLVAIPYLLFRLLRWALRVVATALERSGSRWAITAVAATILVLFTIQRSLQPDAGDDWAGYADHRLFETVDLPPPVSVTYANQFRILAKQMSGEAARLVGPGPSLTASLNAAQKADVFLFFVESYGSVAYDRPEFAAALEESRRELAAAIAETGRDAASAFVESPTFGGGSWLAHISLMTGIEVKDEDTNQVLLTQKRDTLATAFSQHGYRTVAVMPGLQRDWPEGGFYGFDDIYGERRLNYQGPQFGWWVVPDQFSLARLDALELNRRNRPPVFVFMAGVTTHTPFSPTAPYQPDWSRLLTTSPYPAQSVEAAYNDQPDWLNLAPSYIRAMKYVYASIGGYLRNTPTRDVIMIVIGDHQPPALVTGQGAPWDVPVHVITSRPGIVDSLLTRGFRRGVDPRRPVLAKMHELTPILLRALSGDSPVPE